MGSWCNNVRIWSLCSSNITKRGKISCTSYSLFLLTLTEMVSVNRDENDELHDEHDEFYGECDEDHV